MASLNPIHLPGPRDCAMLLREEVRMFDEKLPPRISPAQPQAEPVKLTATTPLHAAFGGFREHMAGAI